MNMQVGEVNKMPLQAVAESRMPAGLRQRLEESQKFRKMTMSADERNKLAIEAQTRRDEEVAKKAQKAIETREKHFEPADIRFYKKQADRHLKLQEKMEKAAAIRESNKEAKIRKARESQAKNAENSVSTRADEKENAQLLKVPLNVNMEVQKKPVDEK